MDFPGFRRSPACGKCTPRRIQWQRRFGTRGKYHSERSALPAGSLRQPSDPPPETAPVAAPAALVGIPPGFDAAPRIAVYRDAGSPPLVVPLTRAGDPADGAAVFAESAPAQDGGPTGAGVDVTQQLAKDLTARAYGLAREEGGGIPLSVFRELIDNLVHASFAGVVITILDGGNTLRVSDQGPGIPDKEAALRPGFTSADAAAKRHIRGVGSGLSVAQRSLAGLGGPLEIEDNLGRGTVITARIPPPVETPLAPVPTPEYNLPERQLKVLLLTVELAPVGPTRIAQELGVSTSTAYRDLVSLEQAGFVVCRPSGHRSATDAGLAYVAAVM